MAIKLLGSLCILAGGGLARFFQLSERRRKQDMLLDLLTAFRRMAEAVRMARTSLPVLLERLAADCGPEAGAFFRAAGEAARSGERFPETWRKLAEGLSLETADRAIVINLGNDLQGDEEKVCKAVSYACLRLAERAEEAERRRPEEEKRAGALWFSAAALLVILLI